MAQRFSPDAVFNHPVETEHDFRWSYESREFDGVCELAHDKMTVRCEFRGAGKKFYDVMMIDGIIKAHLLKPTTVEKVADNLSLEFPDLTVKVVGWSESHGVIQVETVRRW